ncbi:MAG: DUF655 domain-containing protein [Thermoplasmataceae archaeon]|jgi:putative nucleotide binding protein
MEEFAIVLDYLPQGRSEDRNYRKEPLVLAIGETEFKLLELIPKNNAVIAVGEKVYIGKDQAKREKIISVRRRISYSELTNAGQNELPYAIEAAVKKDEQRYIKFFNTADSINTRLHSLELLPGLGNKSMWNILDERKKKPFESFADLSERVKTIHNPAKMIAGRVVQELEERNEKYKIFVAR